METLMRNRATGQSDELLSSGRSALVGPSLHGDFAQITRPGLEYQHAFDYCAVEAHRQRGPVIVAASSAFYASQLLGRVEACDPLLIGADGADASTLAAESVRAIVWAEPEQATGAQALRHLQRSLGRDGCLYVIVSQPLARLLPEWRGDSRPPATSPAGMRRTIGWLRQQGWAIAQLYGFHGPASIVWEGAGRLMARAGRADLADRCHFKMRDTYIVGGAQVALAPVAVLAATRSRAAGAAKEAQ
jgi:hypothetical protein